jgi:hypothetical protein
MIVVVRIHDCLAVRGGIQACSYRAWKMGRLLKDTAFRNRMRFLVAMNGPHVVGVFCIRAVAPDVLPRRVQFDIDATAVNCAQGIEDLIRSYSQVSNKLKHQGTRYLLEEDFQQVGIHIPDFDCCQFDEVYLAQTAEIPIIEGRPAEF